MREGGREGSREGSREGGAGGMQGRREEGKSDQLFRIWIEEGMKECQERLRQRDAWALLTSGDKATQFDVLYLSTSHLS